MSVSTDQRAQVEAEIQDLHQRGQEREAASRALSFYGREILEFLVALHSADRNEADEVFSSFAENFWRTFSGFAWHCSARTWMYCIARHASLEYRRKRGRRRKYVVPLVADAQLSQLIAQVRTVTAAYLRTENKDRIAELRRSLPPDDQTLLMLRVDRELTWKQLAQVMAQGQNDGGRNHADPDTAAAAGAGEPLEGAALEREAARLRKRFQHVKQRLYDLARREGLLS